MRRGSRGGERPGRVGLVAAVVGSLSGGCLIQRPPVPPEFLDLRYQVTDSTEAVAAAFLEGEAAAREVLRERLPSYATQTHADTLVVRMTETPALAPLGWKVREVLDAAIARSSGRVRGAVAHPDAQRKLVEAVVLGLGLALRRVGEGGGARL